MSRTAPEVDILAGGAVIVAAMDAAQVVDRLAQGGFRGKTCPGDDDLTVLVLISGIRGLKTRHTSMIP